MELEDICRELNQDNDRYLHMAMQLEGVVEKLLVALSLPTHSLYGSSTTDYNDLVCFINNETPRLKTLTSGLDVLASLAVGLDRSVDMYKGQIQTLKEDVSRLETENASIRDIEYQNPARHQRPQSQSQSFSNEVSVKDTTITALDDSITTGIDQTSVSAGDNILPVLVTTASDQLPPKVANISQSPKHQHNSDTNLEPLRKKSGVSAPMVGWDRLQLDPYYRTSAAFSVWDASTTPNPLPCSEMRCAISVDGHQLTGNPFFHHPGWQIDFSSQVHVEHPVIILRFGFIRAGSRKLGKNEMVKGFRLMWKLCHDDSFNVKEVKPFEPASLQGLPHALTELCADRSVKGTLWLVSLVGRFDSPPAHSRRISKTVDEDMKINLKALFQTGSKRIDIWFHNPEGSAWWEGSLSMNALSDLQSPR